MMTSLCFVVLLAIVGPALGFSSVADTASATPELTIFLLAAEQAQLAAADPSDFAPGTLLLSDPDLVATVFAPSDSAFEAFVNDLNITTEELLASPDLASILQYHVVPDVAIQAANLTSGPLPTVFGPTLTIGVDSGTVTVTSTSGNTADVVTPDVAAGQSIIHIIDALLLPALAPAPAPAEGL